MIVAHGSWHGILFLSLSLFIINVKVFLEIKLSVFGMMMRIMITGRRGHATDVVNEPYLVCKV